MQRLSADDSRCLEQGKSKEDRIELNRAPDKVGSRKLFFLFLNQNICCGYSKEPSRRDGSFEHPKHMFKLMGKKTRGPKGPEELT